MAGPLGKYGEEKEARRKAAIKSMGGLVGDVVGFIPGAGAVGAGIKKATGLLAGDDAMAATPMPKDEKKSEVKDKRVDEIIAAIKRRNKLKARDDERAKKPAVYYADEDKDEDFLDIGDL